MDTEASIADRLQKLRQWQVEQQERLLKQQQIQREILSHEQDRIYKVLGLPTHDFDIIENIEDTCTIHEIEMNVKETMSDEALILQCSAQNSDTLKMIDKRTSPNANLAYKNCNEQSNNSGCILTIVDKSKSSMKDYSSGVLSQKNELSDLLIEGIKPLLLNDVANRCTSIDDIPLPLSKRDFQTMLEEKLKKESEREIMPNVFTDTKIKTKKPFLKKGQGLARFKMSKNLHPLTAIMKKCNKPSSSNIQHIDRSDKSKKSIVHRHVCSKILDNISVVNKKQQPKKKIFNKPIFTPIDQITNLKLQISNNILSNQSKHLSEMNISDCDSKAEKELEEVRIFELLEEKAENSSFCSTSSTVLAFLQQSTPFKAKNRLNQTRGDDSAITSKKQQKDDEISDMIEQEPMVEKVEYTGKSKSGEQRQVEQFEFCKHSHTIDSCRDDISEETQNCFISTNQLLHSNTACTNHLENHDTSNVTVLSNNDEVRDISMGNKFNLMHDSEVDVSHHVRFSEYNEYRTIDSTDISDTTSNSPLKDHIEQQNWNDCSVDMSESSDIKKLPFNYKEQIHNSSLKIVNNEKTVGTLRQSSLQQDITKHKKEPCNHMTKTIHALEEKNVLNYKEFPNCDNEFSLVIEEVQTSDEERSILSSPLSSLSLSSPLSSSLSDTRELSTHERKEYILRSESEKITKKIAEIYSNMKKADCYPSEERMSQTSTFETELLKSHLLELEKEIDIFRKESLALLLQRRKLQEDETILRKQYAEKEKNFEENKRRIQNQLEEEKKRIAREKIAMENRIRDAQKKAKQNKMERQKAQNLREQLEQLQNELNIKESRWNAAESRYKSEFRVLRVEISKLKLEIANLQNIKRTGVRNITQKNAGKVITKAINQINKRVVTPSKETSIKMCQDLANISSDTSAHDNDNENGNKIKNKSIMKSIIVNDGIQQIEDDFINNVKYKQVEIESQSKCNQTFLEDMEKKQHLYENLLKDATLDVIENQNSFHTKQNMSSDSQQTVTQIQNLSAKSNDKYYSSSTNKDLGYASTCVTNNIEYHTNRSCAVDYDSDVCEKKTDVKIEKEKRKDRTLSLEKNLSSTFHPSPFQSQINKTNIDTHTHTTVKHFPDGRIEYWYPNGNVKKIFPDQEVTKMIYYNGDVRETDKNRKIKYFYATSRTWHTTTPDGVEILEFPDGQVEKRMSDGTVEVFFPDGTVVQTFIDGNKILTLPNGQKEIHTKVHKRREYPDGTVKVVYADGTQETRYSSGRKRLKDKDGNLLMDSYDV